MLFVGSLLDVVIKVKPFLYLDNMVPNGMLNEDFNVLFHNMCSALGQDLATSTYIGEIIFAIIIATFGLVLFALLIGNMQVSIFKPCFSTYYYLMSSKP